MYNKKSLIICIIIISSLFTFCKTKKVKDSSMDNQEEIIFNTKKTTDNIYNANKSMMLILDYTLGKNPIITYSYQVIDAKTKKELKKGVFTGDKIEWLDNNTLKCTPYIGMTIRENDQVIEGSKNENVKYITIKIN
jgi:hypothetical protein